jgi:endonuclease YncB( thermonuclease family)
MNKKARYAPARRKGPVRNQDTLAGLTTSQWLIVFLVAVSGTTALLFTAAYLLLPVERGSASAGTTLSPLPEPTPVIGAQPTIVDAQPAIAALIAPLEISAAAQPQAPTATQTRTPSPVCRPNPETSRTGTLKRILDEVTVEVLVDGETWQVSLAGLRPAPAPQDELARRKIFELAQGQNLLLVTGKQNTTAAQQQVYYLFAGDWFLNAELLRAGLAQLGSASSGHPCDDTLIEAEQIAKLAHLGVWQPEPTATFTPIPTRTFMPTVVIDSLADGCDCSKRYQCYDFRKQSQAQTCYNLCNDYNSALDPDRDGIACEHLP